MLVNNKVVWLGKNLSIEVIGNQFDNPELLEKPAVETRFW
jgi:hypothetical protein